jgi:hypothetical protein
MNPTKCRPTGGLYVANTPNYYVNHGMLYQGTGRFPIGQFGPAANPYFGPAENIFMGNQFANRDPFLNWNFH